MPGAALFPHETVAGETRMIGDVLLDCELEPGVRRQLAGFENHAGRTLLDPGAEPLGRVVHGFGNDGASGVEGCRLGNAVGTYLHGPLLPRNPWLADWLLARALAHAGAGDRRRSRRCPTCSRRRRSASRRSGLGGAAENAEGGISEGHPGPPPAAAYAEDSRVVLGMRRDGAEPRHGTHISPR